MKHKIGIHGTVRLKVIDAATGDVLEDSEQHNQIYIAGLTRLVHAIAAPRTQDLSDATDLPRYKINSIGFGPSSAANPDYDSADYYPNPVLPFIKLLSNDPDFPVSRNNISTGLPDFVLLEHFFTLAADEWNGNTIRELALIANDLGEVPNIDFVVSRVVRAPIVKTNQIRIEGSWFWRFTVELDNPHTL